MNWCKLSTSIKTQVYKRLFINHCYICSQDSRSSLCQHCTDNFQLNTLCCPICKEPNDRHNDICGQCQSHPPSYDYCCAPFLFQGLTKKLLHDCKFHQRLHFIRPLIEAFSHQLQLEYQERNWPEALIYVPSHPERIRERGFCFTQTMSQALHKKLSHEMGIPILFAHRSPIAKHLHTQEQHKLPRKERLKGSVNPYKVSGPIANHIALFDDVMTTGKTLNYCIHALQKAGAKTIDIWVIARTPLK